MGIRYLHLIRHGQYQVEKTKKNYGHLTSLGKYQARRVASRLAEYNPSNLFVSTMIRAEQTGEIIYEKMEDSRFRKCPLIVEGIPEFPDRLAKDQGFKKSKMKQTKTRMNKAYKKYFVPFKGKGERHEALICHGNLIRFLVTKSLSVETAKWINFDILQCSLTTVSIHPDGRTRLLTFGEIGHIPLAKRTHI